MKYLLILLTLICLLINATHAADVVLFRGTLILPPPCIINGDSNIEVDFGDNLQTTDIDGIMHEKIIEYNLDCTDSPYNTLKLQLNGQGASFDPSVLSTSMADLGVKFSSDGGQLSVNNWLNFTVPVKPVLTAVPVKAPSSTLTPGEFTAVATLLVDYQ